MGLIADLAGRVQRDRAGAGGPVLLHASGLRRWRSPGTNSPLDCLCPGSLPRPTRRKRRIGLLLDFRKTGPPAPPLKHHRALRNHHSDGGLVSGTAGGVSTVVRGMVFEPGRRGGAPRPAQMARPQRAVWVGASLVTFLPPQESHSPAEARPGAVQRTLRSISKAEQADRKVRNEPQPALIPHQPVLDRVDRQLGVVLQAQLLQHPGAVDAHRLG